MRKQTKRNFIIIALVLQALAINTHAGFSTGLGYLEPEQYRVDNEINPLPFGVNLVPLISYRSRTLNITGPRIKYNFINGMYGLAMSLNAAGDKYKSYEISEKSTAINGGINIRLLFLSFNYQTDLFQTYNGNTAKVIIAQPFMLSNNIRILPRIGKEFLNTSYTNYYFGVRDDEQGQYSRYSLKNAVNNLAGLTTIIKLTQESSLTLNLSYRELDKTIYQSPTVAKRSYKTIGVFWSLAL